MSILNPLSDAWDSSQAQFDQSVSDLKERAQQFAQLYRALNAKRNVVNQLDQTMQRDYRNLMASGDKVKASVENVTGAIDWTSAKLSDVFNTDNGDVSHLGALPIIGIGAILVAIAALGAWITQARSYMKRLELAERVLNEGGSTSDATRIIHGNDLSEITKFALAAVALYFVWPSIKGVFSGR